MDNRLEKYAKLAIQVGIHLQPGQNVAITSTLECIEFTRLLVLEAYKAKAGHVEVVWNDDVVSKYGYIYQSDEMLSKVPEWRIKQKEEQINRKCAMINVSSPKPKLLSAVEGSKIQVAQKALNEAFAPFRYYTSTSQGQWVGLCVPNAEWANMVYPDLNQEEAMSKLWEAIFKTCRIENDNDPVKLWQEHVKDIVNHRQLLTDYGFKELKFKNSIGTDLSVGLVDDHQWSGGEEKTPAGIGFTPNLPTEEIFCMPHRLQVNGKVMATKPLNISGKICSDFYFIFKDGKVIESGAKENQEALENLLNTDEGSRYLGEVALISHDSPISNLDLVFFNTLYDENASCHLALGNCYGSNFKDSHALSKEDMIKKGANFSMIHCDFMFGSEDMEIVGITKEDKEVKIFSQGNFVI